MVGKLEKNNMDKKIQEAFEPLSKVIENMKIALENTVELNNKTVEILEGLINEKNGNR